MKTSPPPFFKTFSLILCLLITIGTGAAVANEKRTVTLKDGSVLQGRVVGLNAGVYEIETTHLGTVRISDEEILSITSPGVTSSAPAALLDSGSLNPSLLQYSDRLQQQILSDPHMLQELQQLMNNPEIVQLLSDPQFIQKLSTTDPRDLENDPQLQKLMQDPQMSRLIEMIKARHPLPTP